MRKTKHWLMTIAVLLCSIVASAYDFKVNNICYNITSYENLEVEVTRSSDANGYYGTIKIPETVIYNGKTYNVTSIGTRAFLDCGRKIDITIPKSVVSIKSYAFDGSWLTSIIISTNSKLTSIGFAAFNECRALTSIDIPTSVTNIDNSAFMNCESLASVNIPEGLTSIGEYTFYGCSSLTSITIPKSITSIGVGAFSKCSNLTSITIPEGVTSIGSIAFSNCSNLTSVTIPIGATYIGNDAFKGTLWYNNMTDGVVYLGKVLYTYKGTMPENTSIEIREGTVSLSPSALRAQSDLTSIIIPKSVTSIGGEAFYRCNSLASITCKAVTPPTISSSVFSSIDKSIPVYIPAGSVEVYKADDYWSLFTNILAISAGIAIPEVITINPYGSATYCSEYALDFSEVEGLKAYAATGYNTKTGVVTLTRVMTSQPGMGLFLKGEPGEYTVSTLESTDDNSLNMLVGTQESTMLNGTSDDGLYYNYRYTIKEGNEAPLFYQVDDGYTLGAGKAYLQIPAAWMPAEAQAIGLRFDEGGTTDIEEVESKTQDSALLFDLMGRRVVNPQKGMVYIANGKKIIW